MEWLYAPAQVWHLAVVAIALATWLYGIDRRLVTIAKGVLRIVKRLEPELFDEMKSGSNKGQEFSPDRRRRSLGGWRMETRDFISRSHLKMR